MLYFNLEKDRYLLGGSLPSCETLRERARLAQDRHKILEARLKNECKRLDIDSPQRFKNIWVMQEIIKNRREIARKDDPRPVALIIYAKYEEKGKYAYENNDIESLIEAGYRVVYFEAQHENQFSQYITEVGRYNKINLLVIGGHGTPGLINFGAIKKGQTVLNNEELYLDLGDINELKKKNLDKYFYSDALVILEACSTGAGGKKAFNMVNMLNDVFGIRVQGPEEDASLGRYVFDNENKVLYENFSNGKSKLYQAGDNVRKNRRP
jgi:hypothetical protein